MNRRNFLKISTLLPLISLIPGNVYEYTRDEPFIRVDDMVIALEGDNRLSRTTNFSNPSPTWDDITGRLSDRSILGFKVAPDNPRQAYVLTDMGIFFTTNVQHTPPAWFDISSDSDPNGTWKRIGSNP